MNIRNNSLPTNLCSHIGLPRNTRFLNANAAYVVRLIMLWQMTTARPQPRVASKRYYFSARGGVHVLFP